MKKMLWKFIKVEMEKPFLNNEKSGKTKKYEQ